jgi:hypothetical protein
MTNDEQTRMRNEVGAPVEAGNWSDHPFVLCERTVRACIEALPAHVEYGEFNTHVIIENSQSRAALEALLPKPDRAEELLKAWRDFNHFQQWKSYPPPLGWLDEAFARWLITNNHIPGEGK